MVVSHTAAAATL